MERVGGAVVRARVGVVVETCVGVSGGDWIGSGVDGGDGASLCWRMAIGSVVGVSSSSWSSKGMICGA